MNPSEIALLRTELSRRPRTTDVAEMRRNSDQASLANPVAPDVRSEPTVIGGVKAEWTATPNADARRAIVYFHGGGYVIGSIDGRRHVVGEMGRAAATRVLSVDYRLAPEHKFPAAVEDAVAVYRQLIESDFKPQDLALAGDSAGGGLVVAALLAIREAGLPQPACGWAISPWVDMEGIGGSMVSKAAEDPTVQKSVLDFMAGHYLGDADPRHPWASPLYADLSGLAPLLIQVGAAETLLDDAVRLAGIAGAAHVPVTLEIWPDMIHVWHVFHLQLTAGRRAIAAGGTFVKAVMDGNPPILGRG